MALQARDRDDRRRGERHPINPEFVAQGSALTYVSNLSEYGVFVNTRVRLPVGTAVDLRFTELLDDPVVIHGAGRVVHHQDEPRGMGVAFSNLAAVMQLRVIDAINWYRARQAGSEQAFRTRELTADELAQIDEENDDADESSTSLSSSDMVAESGAAYHNTSIEELAPDVIEAAISAAASASARRGPLAQRNSASASQTMPGPPRSSPAPVPAPAPASKPAAAPTRAPLKDDEYEDF